MPAASAGATSVLQADMVQGVADFYAEERAYLCKCQQLVIITSREYKDAIARPCCCSMLPCVCSLSVCVDC